MDLRDTESTVHPRASGEHAAAAVTAATAAGSSPRERGTHRHTSGRVGWRRFIPARAGNTFRRIQNIWIETVHPRASGEHASFTRAEPVASGSSPRERGTLSAQQEGGNVYRFIPARAGNTMRAGARSWATTVHPRASGEHASDGSMISCVNGSSPRERGTPRPGQATPGGRRFIPARAGNTTPRGSALGACAVHPRASGEHPAGRSTSGSTTGSSPRERGTPR